MWSIVCCFFLFFKQKTAYELRISDWSSDVCSSDLRVRLLGRQVIERIDDIERAALARVLIEQEAVAGAVEYEHAVVGLGEPHQMAEDTQVAGIPIAHPDGAGLGLAVAAPRVLVIDEIGRASGRERVCRDV